MLPSNTLIDLLQQMQTLKKRVDIIEPRESLGPNMYYGELYTHENGLTVALGAANTGVASADWTEGLESPDDFVILAGVAGTITIGTYGAGIYRVHIGSSFGTSKANVVVHAYIEVDGVKQNNIGWRRDIGTANSVGNANAEGYLDLVAGNVLTYVFECDVANTNVNIDHGGWNIERINLG